MTGLLWRALGYARFGVEFFVLRNDKPYILGLITNDTCNLDCVGCRVANVTRDVMSMKEIHRVLERYYDKGVRMLYLSGGEPYMWRDGTYRLPDIVELAHTIGYLRVHVYTNGTARLSKAPDFTWISIDGYGDTLKQIRGIPVERVLRNVRRFEGRYAIVFTINTINYTSIRGFLEFLRQELPGACTMFFFHTPYYGKDRLFLSPAQRAEAVRTVLDCRKDGFPVLNSKSALKAYLHGTHGPPLCDSWIVDSFGEYRCCRVQGDPGICRDCGYSTGYEILEARRWHAGAVRALLRTH